MEIINIQETLKDSWVSLHADTSGGQRMIRIFSERRELDISLKYLPSNDLLGVSFDILKADISGRTPPQNANGYSISVKSLDSKKSELSLTATSSQFNELFKTVVSDILDYTLREEDRRKGIAAIYSRLDHWFSFFKAFKAVVMSKSMQVGLYAELNLMNEMLDQEIDIHQALYAWHGPLAKNQDYCFGNLAIEVKGISGNNTSKVHISNARQLDDRGLEDLYLYVASFDRRENCENSLIDLITALRTRFEALGGNAVIQFNTLLLKTGYQDCHKDEYAKFGYSKRSLDYYKVSEGFPRLLEEDLPNGVSNPKYITDLSSALRLKVDKSEVIQQLENTLA